MKALRKVVWAEGTFLGQQHFQQWENYLEGYQNLQARRLSPFGWGLLSLTVDEKGLANGRFRVLECSAVFPDGRLVTYEEAEGSQLICELQGRGGDPIDIYLALPANHDVEGISGYPSRNRLCAWTADYRRVADCYDPQREREVLLARSNLRLMTGAEAREPFYSFQIARVVGEGDGSYRLREEFVPPVSRIGASPRLRAFVAHVADLAAGRQRQLTERMRQGGGGAAAYAQQELANFLLLKTLNGVCTRLAHYQHNPDLHPESLYLLCCQFMGELCTFGVDRDALGLPPYRHDQLTSVFSALESMLAPLLKVAVQGPAAALRLQRESEVLLSAAGIDADTLQSATFFLEVLVEADDPSWMNDFARQVKVSSRGTLELVVASALPGIRLVHTQRPPARLSTRSGHEYFRLEPRGDFWHKAVEEGSLAVFLPQVFAGASVELVTVQE